MLIQQSIKLPGESLYHDSLIYLVLPAVLYSVLGAIMACLVYAARDGLPLSICVKGIIRVDLLIPEETKVYRFLFLLFPPIVFLSALQLLDLFVEIKEKYGLVSLSRFPCISTNSDFEYCTDFIGTIIGS